VDLLAEPNINVTVFAPTNEAFNKLLGDKPLPETCSEDLKAILLYHIAIGKLNSEAFGNTKGFQTYLFPYSPDVEQVFVKSEDSGVRINQSSTVTSANIEASNGIVHIIDTVLVPDQIGTIVEALGKREQFNTLVKAAVASNLATTLAVAPDLTVFAPVNEAFKAVGTPAPDVLTKVLLHHVLGTRVFSSQLKAGYQQAPTLNSDSLTIFGDSSGFSIFGSGQSPTNAGRITATDVRTKNGIIHTISKVLIPANVN
jgi:transforming growth factor-beta-induced protein